MGLQATTARLTYARNDYIGQGRSHIFDKVGDMIYYATLAGVFDTIYVNGSSGSDTAYDGRTPDTAYATLTYALTQATDREDDTIVIMPRDTTEAAYPVSINKRDIHIMAFDTPTRIGADKVYWNSSSAAGLSVAAQNVEIAGFDFVATSSYPGIEFANASYWNCAIHDCSFGRRGSLQDGIHFGGTSRDAAYCTVYDNYFAGGVTRDGIRFAGASTYGWFGLPGHGNFFDVTLIGINVTVNTTLTGIHDNRFLLPSDTLGYAITFSNGSGCAVDGNSAFYNSAPLATNPYRDLGTNHWGVNYRQGLTILPEEA